MRILFTANLPQTSVFPNIFDPRLLTTQLRTDHNNISGTTLRQRRARDVRLGEWVKQGTTTPSRATGPGVRGEIM